MDLLTQGLLGSNLALIGVKDRERLRKAALVGLLAGFAADVDFLIGSSQDPLLNLEFHRHFTHSILFVPIAALVLSIILWPLFRKSFAWRELLLLSALGYSLSGFLDACTSYGTSLLWPLSDNRFSFNIISIVDPVFTLLLILGLAFSVFSRQRRAAALFLGLAAAYLALGWTQNARVEAVTARLAAQLGHQPERILVRPTLGNLLLWRTLYLHDGAYYINAVRLNPFSGEVRIFEGDRLQRYDPSGDQSIDPGSTLGQDIRRFQRFTNDYLAQSSERPGMISDARYANLPTSSEPLWAIQIDPTQADDHAQYHVFRDNSSATRGAFLDMLFNRMD